jgi:hypothetical protein
MACAFLLLFILLSKCNLHVREGGREGTLSQIMLPKIDALYKAFLFVQKTFVTNSMIF